VLLFIRERAIMLRCT